MNDPTLAQLAYQPRRFLIGLVGRPFYKPEVLRLFVDALAADARFAPDSWGEEERDIRPLEELEQAVNGTPQYSVLCLRRRKKVKHFTTFGLSPNGNAVVELDRKLPQRDWHLLFDLGDQLANAFRPQLGWAHIVAEDGSGSNEADRIRDVMDQGTSAYSEDYRKTGPGGLGMRTYLSREFVEIIGLDLLKSCELPLLELPWGGLRVDLVEKPWDASQQALTAAWTRAMGKVRSANFFANFTVAPGGQVTFTRGERWPTTRLQ